MLFNLSKLCNKSIMNLSVNEKIELDNINAFGEEIIFNTPVELKGTFVNKDEYVEFNGEVSCNLKLICSKCLETFDETFEVKIDEKFSRNEQEDYFELPVSCEIDLGRIIEENIVGYLPIQKDVVRVAKVFAQFVELILTFIHVSANQLLKKKRKKN